ncbi:SDH family Clp fold serine proteinase [Candidatus Avelusimicrobium sp.]
MAINSFNNEIKKTARNFLMQLENYFKEAKADVLFYNGDIDRIYEQMFRTAIEGLVKEHKKNHRETLIVILQTNGGSVETAEKYVKIIRTYYKKVYFIIPNYAMSAGTIFCMSGNKIFMDCSSCLGPIDPQIYSIKEQRYVPANGYLDEMQSMIKKSQEGTLTNVEFVMCQNQDLAFLNHCRQTASLAVNLLEEWLVKYKFADWNSTETTHRVVTEEDKKARAREIAEQLGKNTKWHVHSRPIMLDDLNRLRIKIDDYTYNKPLKKLIRQYSDYILQYIDNNNPQGRFIHTRLFF